MILEIYYSLSFEFNSAPESEKMGNKILNREISLIGPLIIEIFFLLGQQD
jgi:hypothetical protein